MTRYIYTSKQDAIEQYIIPAIEGSGQATADEYDLDYVFDRVFTYEQALDGFIIEDSDVFWDAVQEKKKMSNIPCKSCEADGLKLSEHDYCNLCLEFNTLNLRHALGYKASQEEAQKLISGYTRRFGADDWHVEELKDLLK